MSEMQTWQPMPSEIEVRQSVQDVAIQRLGEWARSADAAHQIAGTLVQTSFCPEAFRNKPGEATAAILAGLEVGLQPMAALRSFDVIQGTAAPRAITLRAIVQSHGHEIVLEESTAGRCKMKGRRRGTSEWSTVVWTLDRAKQLGVTNKPNWRNQPQAMLVARATSELARLIASDAILGIGYSSEEVADGGPTDAQVTVDTTTPTAAPATRKMSRKKAEPAPEPPADGGDPRSEPLMLDPTSDLAKAMFATYNELDVTDRDERLAHVSRVVGREVTGSAEMTEDDVRAVLRDLDAAKNGQANQLDPATEPTLPDPTDPTDPWANGGAK